MTAAPRILALLLGLVTAALTLVRPAQVAAPHRLSQKSSAPIAWVELGPDGVAIARAITQDSACPRLDFTNGSAPMLPRSQPVSDYAVLVCEARLPTQAQDASIQAVALPVPRPNPRRILVLGDTGCRLKEGRTSEQTQACNDPVAWPAATIAAAAAAWQPDLIIHVGDYLYRESPCPGVDSGCAGSPHGYNWDSWNADFFAPEAALLPTAPWVFVRGDHELCDRAGEGWFRFLDPRPMQSTCHDYTDPYAIPYGDLNFLMLDSALADDFRAVPDQVAAYRPQFDQIAALARPNSWFLTHRPLWVFGVAGEQSGVQQLFRDNPTLQAAANNNLPAAVSLALSGHIHLFEALGFDDNRPPQLIVGNGGTQLDPEINGSLVGMDIGGEKVVAASSVDAFGFVTMERGDSGWIATLRDAGGSPRLLCSISGKSIDCSPY
jgi:calcineurin-like phosphoesterase family protein